MELGFRGGFQFGDTIATTVCVFLANKCQNVFLKKTKSFIIALNISIIYDKIKTPELNLKLCFML
jgi:hypothetical protein